MHLRDHPLHVTAMAFVKLHGSILDSSIWSSPAEVRLVWITMLAMADEFGVVSASVDGLAHRARVSIEATQDALRRFLGPDEFSRDGTTGERIEEVPGGWLVLNHANYRDKQTRQQALTAARVARHRAKVRATRNEVTPDNATSPSEAEAEAEYPPTPLRGANAGQDPELIYGTEKTPLNLTCCSQPLWNFLDEKLPDGRSRWCCLACGTERVRVGRHEDRDEPARWLGVGREALQARYPRLPWGTAHA